MCLGHKNLLNFIFDTRTGLDSKEGEKALQLLTVSKPGLIQSDWLLLEIDSTSKNELFTSSVISFTFYKF